MSAQRGCGTSRSCFNSLQTGKHIQSYTATRWTPREMSMFQFPSNGKAYPKELSVKGIDEFRSVSIPFKREGISKGATLLATRLCSWLFQFPSNGKAYPKCRDIFTQQWMPFRVSIPFKREGISKASERGKIIVTLSDGFHFPSNGKAYPKPILWRPFYT